jgi:uncharacterized protein YlzI (FlbEa/FlbD family)
MSLVFGNNVMISFYNGSVYLPFGCARSTTVNLLSDTTGKSTVGSGDWKEKEITALDWNFTLEGVISLNSGLTVSPGNITANEIYRQWFTKNPIFIEFVVTADDGTFTMMNGEALITNISTNGAINSTSSINITGEGTGQLTSSVNFVITNVQANTPAAGQTTLTFDFDTTQGATAYTIKQTELTTGIVTNDTAAGPPRTRIVTSIYNYSFQLKPEPTGDFGPPIYWPVPQQKDNYIIDNDSNLIKDNDGAFLFTK